MFKVNNKDTRATPGVVLMPLLLTLNIFAPCSIVSIVNFEHVIAGRDILKKKKGKSNVVKIMGTTQCEIYKLGLFERNRSIQ